MNIICWAFGHKEPCFLPGRVRLFKKSELYKLCCVRCGKTLLKEHAWDVCSMCGPMVRCGYCGNNCCNGGSGNYGTDKKCPDNCQSAYALQDKEDVQRMAEFKSSEAYVTWKNEREEWLNKGEL